MVFSKTCPCSNLNILRPKAYISSVRTPCSWPNIQAFLTTWIFSKSPHTLSFTPNNSCMNLVHKFLSENWENNVKNNCYNIFFIEKFSNCQIIPTFFNACWYTELKKLISFEKLSSSFKNSSICSQWQPWKNESNCVEINTSATNIWRYLCN